MNVTESITSGGVTSESTVIELSRTINTLATLDYAISPEIALAFSVGYSNAELSINYIESAKNFKIVSNQSISGFVFGPSISAQVNEQYILDLSAQLRSYEAFNVDGTGTSSYIANLSSKPQVSSMSLTITHKI